MKKLKVINQQTIAVIVKIERVFLFKTFKTIHQENNQHKKYQVINCFN
jgi:hypothetical protein